MPTFTELGFPDLTGTNWFALAAPAGLPSDIAEKVNREIARMVQRPDIEKRLRADGLVPEALSLAELRGLIVAETARWKPLLKEVGLAAP